MLSAIHHLTVPGLKQQHITITPHDCAPRLVYQDIGGVVWRSLKVDIELYPLIEYRRILTQPQLLDQCDLAREATRCAILNLRLAADRQQAEDRVNVPPTIRMAAARFLTTLETRE